MREPRQPLVGFIAFQDESGEWGAARWRNINRIGAGVRLGRYLRPGHTVVLVFSSPTSPEETTEIQARVVWCRRVPGAFEFEAGLRVLRECPEEAVAYAGLVRKVRDCSATPEPVGSNKAAATAVETRAWPGFHDKESEGWRWTLEAAPQAM